MKETDKHVYDDFGVTALMHAADAGHYMVCRLLEETGCRVTDKDFDNWTPLMYAADAGRLHITEFFCNQHLKSDVVNRSKNLDTVLMKACAHGHLSVVKYLVTQKDCDININNKDGNTPILIAAYYMQLPVVSWLAARETINLKKENLENYTVRTIRPSPYAVNSAELRASLLINQSLGEKEAAKFMTQKINEAIDQGIKCGLENTLRKRGKTVLEGGRCSEFLSPFFFSFSPSSCHSSSVRIYRFVHIRLRTCFLKVKHFSFFPLKYAAYSNMLPLRSPTSQGGLVQKNPKDPVVVPDDMKFSMELLDTLIAEGKHNMESGEFEAAKGVFQLAREFAIEYEEVAEEQEEAETAASGNDDKKQENVGLRIEEVEFLLKKATALASLAQMENSKMKSDRKKKAAQVNNQQRKNK